MGREAECNGTKVFATCSMLHARSRKGVTVRCASPESHTLRSQASGKLSPPLEPAALPLHVDVPGPGISSSSSSQTERFTDASRTRQNPTTCR